MNQSLQIISVINKKYAVSEEDAELIFPIIENAVKENKHLNLSFEGIDICSSLFLKNSLGKLYLTFGPKVDECIHFIGIENEDVLLPSQLERLRKRALNPSVYQPIFDKAIAKA